MFRRSRMNQSRLPPVEQLLFIHKVTGSTRAWRHLAPYILPSDICELHTSAHAHTREASHISPCRVAPSPSPRLSSLQPEKYALAYSTAVRASRSRVGGFINGGACVN